MTTTGPSPGRHPEIEREGHMLGFVGEPEPLGRWCRPAGRNLQLHLPAGRVARRVGERHLELPCGGTQGPDLGAGLELHVDTGDHDEGSPQFAASLIVRAVAHFAGDPTHRLAGENLGFHLKERTLEGQPPAGAIGRIPPVEIAVARLA